MIDPGDLVLDRIFYREDVPMGLQLLASIGAPSCTADVASAFGQTMKGQRGQEGAESLFATPPKEEEKKMISSSRSLPRFTGWSPDRQAGGRRF